MRRAKKPFGKEKLVRLTATGRLSVLLPAHTKDILTDMIESFEDALRQPNSHRLDARTLNGHIQIELLREVSRQYGRRIFDPDTARLTFSRAHALVIWGALQSYKSQWDAETGNLLMQLHKTLI